LKFKDQGLFKKDEIWQKCRQRQDKNILAPKALILTSEVLKNAFLCSDHQNLQERFLVQFLCCFFPNPIGP
jgi:hypothetical protein